MNNLQNELTILERIAAPTPAMFKTIRTAGLIILAVSGTLIGLKTQGIELPAAVQLLADKTYVLAGAVATLISSLTVDFDAYKKQNAL